MLLLLLLWTVLVWCSADGTDDDRAHRHDDNSNDNENKNYNYYEENDGKEQPRPVAMHNPAAETSQMYQFLIFTFFIHMYNRSFNDDLIDYQDSNETLGLQSKTLNKRYNQRPIKINYYFFLL